MSTVIPAANMAELVMTIGIIEIHAANWDYPSIPIAIDAIKLLT